MTNKAELEAAAAAGVISAEQAGKLNDFLAKNAASAGVAPPLSGEEDFRFIRNFHDLFLAIGIVLFAIGMAVGIGSYIASSAKAPASGAVLTGSLCAVAALTMWGLGELFARRRRLFLPAIATVIAFTLFAAVATVSLYFGILVGRGVNLDSDVGATVSPLVQAGLLLAAAMFFIAPALFYARFRLPFSIGMTGGGVAFFVIVCALVFAFDSVEAWLPALYLGLGVALFAAGVAFDARDPSRVSRMSDNGFWLHFAAAPLILNGAFGLLNQAFVGAEAGVMGGSGGLIMAGSGEGDATALALATLLVVVMLGFVSLLINRRVLIVSALITTGIAIGILLNELGIGAGSMAASTLIVLGGFVLILGAGWHSVRRALLGWVKPGGVWARIFPPEAPA
jgi:hypothetical protein